MFVVRILYERVVSRIKKVKFQVKLSGRVHTRLLKHTHEQHDWTDYLPSELYEVEHVKHVKHMDI